MLFRLKSQLEELRSRVVFLECVKKYLQVRTPPPPPPPLASSSPQPLQQLLTSPCVSQDPERGAMGFGPLGAAFADCLWTWFFGASVL